MPGEENTTISAKPLTIPMEPTTYKFRRRATDSDILSPPIELGYHRCSGDFRVGAVTRSICLSRA